MQIEDAQAYAEEMGLYFEWRGIGRSAGKILGWLLICDPPEQSMDDICDGLGLAKSTVSPALRFLIGSRMIEKISLPGIRRDYYRMTPNFWITVMHASMEEFTRMLTIAEKGLALLEDEPPARRAQMEQMRDFYAFIMREMPALMERWQEEANTKYGTD